MASWGRDGGEGNEEGGGERVKIVRRRVSKLFGLRLGG